MRFELLAVFDSTDSPNKKPPLRRVCFGYKTTLLGGFYPFPHKPGGLCRWDLRVSVASGPAMVANNKRVQVAIVKNCLDVAGLNARA